MCVYTCTLMVYMYWYIRAYTLYHTCKSKCASTCTSHMYIYMNCVSTSTCPSTCTLHLLPAHEQIHVHLNVNLHEHLFIHLLVHVPVGPHELYNFIWRMCTCTLYLHNVHLQQWKLEHVPYICMYHTYKWTCRCTSTCALYIHVHYAHNHLHVPYITATSVCHRQDVCKGVGYKETAGGDAHVWLRSNEDSVMYM